MSWKVFKHDRYFCGEHGHAKLALKVLFTSEKLRKIGESTSFIGYRPNQDSSWDLFKGK